MQIKFHTNAQNDYQWLEENKPKLAAKINQLLENIAQSPYRGLGKPEALKYEFSGFWSRRIDDEHRIVYRVDADGIYVLQCRWHYKKN